MKLTENKSALVLEICRTVEATCYLSRPLGQDYLVVGLFQAHGIEVRFHDFESVTYQHALPDFESDLATIDLLTDYDNADALAIMASGRNLN